jgi:hypothetical protein
MGGGKWIKIYPGEIKAIRFTRARCKNPLCYSLGDQKIPESSSCKYLGIFFRIILNWVNQVNYRAQKVWKALHFVMSVLKEEIGIKIFSLHVNGTSYS